MTDWDIRFYTADIVEDGVLRGCLNNLLEVERGNKRRI